MGYIAEHRNLLFVIITAFEALLEPCSFGSTNAESCELRVVYVEES